MSSTRSATVTYQRARHAVLPGQLGDGDSWDIRTVIPPNTKSP
jgi:hypothetical protein